MHIKTIWKILTLVNKVAYNNYMKQNEKPLFGAVLLYMQYIIEIVK